ncbi:MAG: glycosyltransferase family protein [archaeon]
MKKLIIVYGINSDGLGHTTRSIPIIDNLIKKGHKVYIISEKNVFNYLNNRYKNNIEVEQPQMDYSSNSVQQLKTGINYVLSSKKTIKSINKTMKIIKQLKPDIIISDLERSTLYAGQFLEIPTISIDNHSAIFRGDVEFSFKNIGDFLLVKLLSKILCPRADKYLALCFFRTKITKARTEVFDPILRDEIYKAKIKDENFIYIYNRFGANIKNLKKILKKIKNEKFVVYGQELEETYKNIIFKGIKKDNYTDLAKAKAVITNGGHSLISESILFKKPIYSIPVKHQFEQEVNAYYIEKLGFGERHKDLNSRSLNNFISNVAFYKKNLSKHKFLNKNKFFKRLDEVIIELVRKKEEKIKLGLPKKLKFKLKG